MWRYACRPTEYEPHTLKIKWAGKHQLPGFEVALACKCHFIPLAILLEVIYRLFAKNNGGFVLK